MTRRSFTKNIAQLIIEMGNAGEEPIIDYALRSEQEQRRLFDAGLSKCDGKDKKSRHQNGTAMDIYLCTVKDGVYVSTEYTWDADKAAMWHKRWEEMGGVPMIEWDRGHFEG